MDGILSGERFSGLLYCKHDAPAHVPARAERTATDHRGGAEALEAGSSMTGDSPRRSTASAEARAGKPEYAAECASFSLVQRDPLGAARPFPRQLNVINTGSARNCARAKKSSKKFGAPETNMSGDENCRIYALRDPRTNRIGYVGSTLNLAYRFWAHCYYCLIENRPKDRWLRPLIQAGL